MTTQNEIAELLQNDEISIEAAVRLILKSQSVMQSDTKALSASAAAGRDYNRQYPPLIYLFATKPKQTVAIATAIFLFLHAALIPITNQAAIALIASLLGIPLP